MITIDVSKKSINSDRAGYEYLTSIYHEIINTNNKDKDIDLNFKKTTWIDANLSAVLGAILRIIKLNGYNVFFSNLNRAISSILNRNGFLSFGDNYKPSSSTDTVINYWQFASTQNDSFSIYVNDEILSKTCFPKCSDLLKDEIVRNMFELFNNAATHGQSDYIFTCGQHYPNKNPATLDFTIVDIGNTFLKNVNNYKSFRNEPVINSHEAIDWATKERNSTKIGKPGGLGLSLLLDFLNLNKGKIQIISDNGYWEYYNGKVNNYNTQLNHVFPGAIINIEFNVEENNDYYLLKKEVSISVDNIF